MLSLNFLRMGLSRLTVLWEDRQNIHERLLRVCLRLG